MSDASGAIATEEGIDAEQLAGHVRDGGNVGDFDGSPEEIDPDDLLALECDVCIPAALGGMIHKANADSMRCRMMVEGANSPTTPAADSILNDKGVLIVPDVLANAGGVVVSYFEWVQNLQHLRWDEEQVNERLYELGIERVVEAASTRGYI